MHLKTLFCFSLGFQFIIGYLLIVEKVYMWKTIKLPNSPNQKNCMVSKLCFMLASSCKVCVYVWVYIVSQTVVNRILFLVHLYIYYILLSNNQNYLQNLNIININDITNFNDVEKFSNWSVTWLTLATEQRKWIIDTAGCMHEPQFDNYISSVLL